MPNKKPPSEIKNKTLSIRLDNAQYDLIKSESWKRKTSSSGMIRKIVLSEITREVAQQQLQA